MSLSITVLGCSGTFAGPGDACSGYLLRTENTTVWLDCGPGTLGNLQRHIRLDELDGLVVTHEHPDHWLELPVLANALRYGVGLPDGRLPLFWTAGTEKFFRVISHHGPEPTFAPQVVHDGAVASIGDIDLRFSRTDHPVETMAVRADAGGRSLVYSSDTGPGWSMAALGGDIDLALVEAALEEDDEGTVQHLSGRQAGSLAATADVASLLITHVTPVGDPQRRLEEASGVYDGPIDLARTGHSYEV